MPIPLSMMMMRRTWQYITATQFASVCRILLPNYKGIYIYLAVSRMLRFLDKCMKPVSLYVILPFSGLLT